MPTVRPATPSDASALRALFIDTFTESEGAEEGARLGRLVESLMTETDPQDLAGFVAVEGETMEEETMAGAIFFSRLGVAEDLQAALLSPVAVHGAHQGQGVGQALITHGVERMRARGVQLVVTYGDPAFYTKVGFAPVSTEALPPPYPLSQPEGWLAQSLTEESILPLSGPCTCVAAFQDPGLW